MAEKPRMSTAPIIDSKHPPTWEGQLGDLLARYRNFATRADAQSDLLRMASVVALYAANRPAERDAYTNVEQLLRTALQAHLDGDADAYTRLLHLARLADTCEAQVKG
jgi:Mlc titration factor MtfA (ptsG expression regulator)